MRSEVVIRSLPQAFEVINKMNKADGQWGGMVAMGLTSEDKKEIISYKVSVPLFLL